MSICGTSASAHPSAFVAAGDTGVRGLSLQRIRACAGGCIYTVASVFMQNGQSHIRINAILVVYEFLSILRSGQRSHNQTVWVTVAETQLGVTAAHVFSICCLQTRGQMGSCSKWYRYMFYHLSCEQKHIRHPKLERAAHLAA